MYTNKHLLLPMVNLFKSNRVNRFIATVGEVVSSSTNNESGMLMFSVKLNHNQKDIMYRTNKLIFLLGVVCLPKRNKTKKL